MFLKHLSVITMLEMSVSEAISATTRWSITGTSFLLALTTAVSAGAATIGADFAADYAISVVGSAPNVPGSYGGLVVDPNNPNALLLGGSANTAAARIFSVPLVRDADGHIIGFAGSATNVYPGSDGGGGIDGGLTFGPGGVLFFTSYPDNQIHEIKPGESTISKTLTPPVGGSAGALAFVPTGFPGAGNAIIASYSASQYCATTAIADGNGTYDFGPCSATTTISGGPEGILFVPLGSPGFSSPSVLITEYGLGRVSAYELSSAGLPIAATRRDFITGLGGAEGAVLDPLTNDFLFSTFGGGDQVVRVTGFAEPVVSAVPEPGTFTLISAGLGAAILRLRQRRR